MRIWSNRPVLILAAVLVLLGVMIVYFLRPGPARASGQVVPDRPTVAAYNRTLNQLMDEIDKQ